MVVLPRDNDDYCAASARGFGMRMVNCTQDFDEIVIICSLSPRDDRDKVHPSSVYYKRCILIGPW